MKIFNILILLSFFVLCAASPAGAEPKSWRFGWWPGHWTWTNYKNFHPYLENGKETQNQQWAAEDWYVQDWLAQEKDGFQLIDGFFKADILRELEKDEDDEAPVLIVGPQFYRLGGFDKRRVVTTLDEVYGITGGGKYKMIQIKDWHTGRDIGHFSKEGLQIE